jgi:hypothetical protein
VQLGSWSVTANQAFGGCPWWPVIDGCGLVTMQGLTGPSLTAGQTYFLAIVVDAGSDVVWDFDNQGAFGPSAGYSDGWNAGSPGFSGMIFGAFDILGSGSSTPEPTSMLLMVAGLLCLLACSRKRAVR